MRRLLPILLVLLCAVPAAAGSYDVFGTGARAIALGGAYSAISNDISGLYYNTAALAQVERLHVEFGYAYAQPKMIINGRAQNIDDHRGVTLGGILSTKVFDRRLSLGLNVFMPDHHMLRFLVLSINQPHSAFRHNANHSFTIMSGAGYEIFSWMRVGMGINVLAKEKGGMDFAITEDRPSEGAVFSELSPNYALMGGLHFTPTEWLRLGLAFRDKLELQFNLPNDIGIPSLKIFDGNRLQVLRPSQLYLIADSNSHFSPRAYVLGAAFDITDRWLAALNVEYNEWSDMSTDAPYASAFVYGGLADVFPTQPGRRPKPPDFDDVFSYHVGAEFRPVLREHLRVDVRTGYWYRPTPVPEQRYANNYLDSDTHIFSAGAGIRGDDLSKYLPRSVQFDTFFQYQYGQERVYKKADPTDFLGDLKFQETWWNAGGNLTVRF
ncbi:MAG: outer membrane protein transport protein [Candidatus Lernaella stagnicola]|nr:outer membrane protein transport protein [Candidatus Lernaella stagnicola]